MGLLEAIRVKHHCFFFMGQWTRCSEERFRSPHYQVIRPCYIFKKFAFILFSYSLFLMYLSYFHFCLFSNSALSTYFSSSFKCSWKGSNHMVSFTRKYFKMISGKLTMVNCFVFNSGHKIIIRKVF